MKNIIINILKLLGLYQTYKVPLKISKKFTKLSPNKKNEILELTKSYCKKENYKTNKSRQIDIEALSEQRLNRFRKSHIPFLEEKVGLKGKKILEIGCGSGSSSVALSEQGALITGIDIDEKALSFAKKRAKIYNQNIAFIKSNAVNLDKLKKEDWDIIIYFASLEHMTPFERKKSLSQAFTILKKGTHLCVFGTPNRLWPIDIHTSQLPFYMWLQDDIALDYAKFSSRKEFSEISNNENGDMNLLYRWGRGVSFHEFHNSFEKIEQINVVGSLPIFLRKHSLIQKLSYKRSNEYKYKSALKNYGPNNIHPGFYECYLDIIIKV